MISSDAPAPAALLAMLPHRYPFLLIDRVVEVERGERVVALKCVSVNEPFFQGHFPDLKVMPGVLICEAFAQASALIALSEHPEYTAKAFYLMGLNKVRFKRPVVPGDRMRVEAVKRFVRRGVWRFDCRAEVDGQLVARGELTATVADRPSEG